MNQCGRQLPDGDVCTAPINKYGVCWPCELRAMPRWNIGGAIDYDATGTDGHERRRREREWGGRADEANTWRVDPGDKRLRQNERRRRRITKHDGEPSESQWRDRAQVVGGASRTLHHHRSRWSVCSRRVPVQRRG